MLKKKTSSNRVNLWLTPVLFHLEKGILETERMDALLADSIHVCTHYVTTNGKPSYVLSISGLEFLCKNITGHKADQNRPKFLELLDTFKNSYAAIQDSKVELVPTNSSNTNECLVEEPIKSKLSELSTVLALNAQAGARQLDDLKDQIGELKNENHTLKIQLKESTEAKQNLQQTVDLTQAKLSNLEEIAAGLRNALQLTSSTMSRAELEIHELYREREFMTKKMVALFTDLERAKNAICCLHESNKRRRVEPAVNPPAARPTS